jgi:hypothetical protein
VDDFSAAGSDDTTEYAAALQRQFGLNTEQLLAALTTLQLFGRVADMVDSAIEGDLFEAPESDLSPGAIAAALTQQSYSPPTPAAITPAPTPCACSPKPSQTWHHAQGAQR